MQCRAGDGYTCEKSSPSRQSVKRKKKEKKNKKAKEALVFGLGR
jgi:hypothetical protein